MPTLLVVDDEPSICWGLTRLGEELGHRVLTASSAEQAFKLLDELTPDVIVLDVRLPGINGLQAMEHFQQRCGKTPLIVMTAYGDLDTAVSAIRNGAFEYIVKPFDLAKVQHALTRALAFCSMPDTESAKTLVGGLIGRSALMQEVFKRIALAAGSDVNILLSGESGTGKELAARAIHQYSSRAEGPFVAVNVAALNPSLTEDELFGHVRGSFTGAERDREGLLVQANGGTLFLDEVADIPLPVQAKLLRALEHKEILPIGANQPMSSDFRVISASHQNLLTKIQDETFRHDLYFRLGAFEIVMPPLRDRTADIPELAEHFLEIAARGGRSRPTLSSQAVEELSRRPWFGNVRELRNAVEHAAMLARGGIVDVNHLPPVLPIHSAAKDVRSIDAEVAKLLQQWVANELDQGADVTNLYDRFLRIVEPPLLAAALERHRQQCATTARTLGMHRTTLRKKLDEYGLMGE